jgi:hypothetical protein
MNIDMQNAFIAGLASGGVVVGDGTKSHAVIGNLEIASVPSGYSEYEVTIGEEITAQYVVSLGIVAHTGGATTGSLQGVWYYVSKKTSASFTVGIYAVSALTNLAFDWAVITEKAYPTCNYGVENGMVSPYTVPSGTSTLNVVFDEPKDSTDYFVVANLGQGAAYFAEVRMWVSNKSTTGFTINLNSAHATVSGTAIRWFCIDKSGVSPEPSNVLISTAETQIPSSNSGYALAEMTNTSTGATNSEDVGIFYAFRNSVKAQVSGQPFGVITAALEEKAELSLWTGYYYGGGQVTDCAFVVCQPANEGAT